MAGATNSGPRTPSRLSHSPNCNRNRGRRAATMTLASALAMRSRSLLPVQDLLHLVRAPGDSVLGGRAGDRLGDHVGQDEGIGDELDLVARGRGPAVAMELDALGILERGELRIGLEHGMVDEVRVRGKVEGVA